ncbi:MAG: lipid A-modifier LpxR family protein, partial [Desulfuromonas sp.]
MLFRGFFRSVSTALLLGMCLIPRYAAAAEDALWTIQVANDAFLNQDRGYTSGIQFERSAAGSPWSFWFGQDMFTPDANKAKQPPEGQHPYGAWLYAGGEYRIKLKQNTLLTTGLTLGTTGERALGKETQDITHNILGFSKYHGWDSQISRRWGWIFDLALAERIPVWHTRSGMSADIIGRLEGRGGNIYVDANVGATVRLGLNVPELEAHYNPHPQSSLYLSAGYDFHVVDKNVFLEGVKSSDYSVEPKRTYESFQAGIHWRYERFRIDMDFYFPQKYFKDQQLNCRYGVLSVGYWF